MPYHSNPAMRSSWKQNVVGLDTAAAMIEISCSSAVRPEMQHGAWFHFIRHLVLKPRLIVASGKIVRASDWGKPLILVTRPGLLNAARRPIFSADISSPLSALISMMLSIDRLLRLDA